MVLGSWLTDVTEAVRVPVVVQLFAELLERMSFPGNLMPFRSHRRFTGLTGVCSRSSAFCRLVMAKRLSY